MLAIDVKHLSKFYRQYPSAGARLAEWASFGKVERHEKLWALQDISFEVEQGEALGIIGVNGAGKSTLLSILMGTTYASSGHHGVGGQIAGLLELGLGLHPGFSGEQNALLALQMRGLDAHEAQDALAQVVEFSELEDAIKRPIRTYSTGMQMRLGFAIATARRPDVLIVDEALAVGDAPFQFKCIERIKSFRAQGSTLLFVSHDLASMRSLCTRGLLLNKGRMVCDGMIEEVLDRYNALISGHMNEEFRAEKLKPDESAEGSTSVSMVQDLDSIQTRSGSGKARFEKVWVENDKGKSAAIFTSGDQAHISCQFMANEQLSGVTVGMMIRDRFSADVFGINSFGLGLETTAMAPGDKAQADFKVKLDLAPGHYFITVAVHAGQTHLEGNYDWIDNVATFEVLPDRSTHFAGLVNLPHEASFTKV